MKKFTVQQATCNRFGADFRDFDQMDKVGLALCILDVLFDESTANE